MALGVGCSAGVLALIWEMWWDITLGFQTEALVCFLLGVLFAAIRLNPAQAPKARIRITSMPRTLSPTLAR
jgi:hypothetical protein